MKDDILKIKKIVEIKSWLDDMEIEGYTINSNLSVDVKYNVDLSNRRLKEIPIQFKTVGGVFFVFENELTSNKGFPLSCPGIYCDGNPEIIYRPSYHKGDFFNDVLNNTFIERKEDGTIGNGKFGNRIEDI